MVIISLPIAIVVAFVKALANSPEFVAVAIETYPILLTLVAFVLTVSLLIYTWIAAGKVHKYHPYEVDILVKNPRLNKFLYSENTVVLRIPGSANPYSLVELDVKEFEFAQNLLPEYQRKDAVIYLPARMPEITAVPDNECNKNGLS